MNKIYQIAVMLILSINLIGQVDVTFNVSSANTSMGIENASILLDGVSQLTDVNGNTTFTGIAPGAYSYTASNVCFESMMGTLIVDDVNVSQAVEMTDITSAPVFVLTSNHPIIGSWVDGHVNLTDGTNTYDYDVTEFDNIIVDVVLGTYTYTFTQAGGCYAPITGTLVVDCDAIDPQSGNVLLNILDEGDEITSAPVFVLTSNHPIIGSWVDGHVNLTDGTNSFDYDVTEFDNIIADVPFGTYDYTFTQTGTCFSSVTGTITIDCDAINFQSGNVLLNIFDPETGSAPVFVLTSNHPIIGSWVDGHVNLTDGTNTYDYDVTEFDNIIVDVVLGTYTYTFTQAGGCYAPITGTLVVDCDAIDPQSGNVLLNILDEGDEITSAPVFVLTSNHPIIGSWVDGHVNLTDGTNSFDYDVTEFDNIIADVPFGTYDYTFTQTGTCFSSVTGTITIDCDAINFQSGNVLLNIFDPETGSAPVFVLTSNHPIIGSWVDGHVNLTNGTNTYDYDVTEFDNIIVDVVLGTYTYTFTQAGGCYAPITGTLVVDCDAIDPQSGNVLLNILDEGDEITSAPVFVLTSNHPIIGSWVDGHVNLTDGTNSFDYDVTEFDNIIADVPFGTYDYTFTQTGTCFSSVTGTITIDCDAINFQSGNVLLNIFDPETGSAPVFVLTSNHPIIGSWVDGHVNLTDGTNTYDYDVTEFDNIIVDVVLGTYTYTFTQAGGCYAPITGTLVVDCDAIDPQSGNVLLNILDEGDEITSAPVFVLTSNHPIIGSWVDGHVNLTDGTNSFDYDVTEFDNIIADVPFGTYDYTFTQTGTCFSSVTGTITIDCDAINFQSGNVLLNIFDPETGSAPVFVLTSNHPIIGSWVDGHVNLTNGTNTYDYDVTEFDNIIVDVVLGTYTYTFTQAGGCFAPITGTLVVDCDAIDPQSGNVLLNILDEGEEITSAPVFVLTSNHPIIGSWVDGSVNLTDGTNTYDYDVTEFDNIIVDVPFGTYDYTFTQTGTCFSSVTGTITIDCDAINFQSGNVLLNIFDPETGSAPVFVLTSNHPIIGSWVDGHVNLTDGTNTYDYDVTEFDNIIVDVVLGTYTYTFTQAGGCYAPITGTLVVDCDAIDPQSGNVLLNILDEGDEITSASVFVLTSNHPIIGSWVDGLVTLTDGTNSYEYSVTEFDNIFADVPFGTYEFTFTQAGGCFTPITGTLVVDCDAINPQSGNILLNILDEGEEITSAPVFVLTSNHPIIGSWVDGLVTLTDGTNSYEYSVTEFDNIFADVPFGTYEFTFTQAGGCFTPITGTLVVDCDAIDPQSGNILLNILDEGEEITSAPVFVLTSNHPIIGSWVDGLVTLTDGTNSYEYSVTEFDNIFADVPFGTYEFTFTQAGGCFTPITGTLVVDCDAIIPQSGNILLNILDEGEEIIIDATVENSNNTLTAAESGDDISYQWIDCDNNNTPIDGETNQAFTPLVSGNYAVIISNINCPEPAVSECMEIIISSTKNLDSSLNIDVFPNPTDGISTIAFTEQHSQIQMSLTNVFGKRLANKSFTNTNSIVLDLATYPPGIYVIRIEASGTSTVVQLIKQ